MGDSGKELNNIMKKIDRSALFWLDSHYMGQGTDRGEKDSPIQEELNAIFDSSDRKHIIVIDDAHYFGKDPSYPSIEELKKFVQSKRNNVDIFIEGNSIRILPKTI